MAVRLPAGGVRELEEQVTAAATGPLGMSAGAVTYYDPYERPPLSGSDLLLQSPQVSVVIAVQTSNRSDRARIIVRRTCYSDALEDWRPYWRGLRAILRNHGYRLDRR